MSSDSENKNDPGDALDPREEGLADLAGFALTGRNERVEDGILMMAPPELKAGVRDVRELLSLLGRAEPRQAPSSSVRARLMSTLTQQRRAKKALVVIDMINDHLQPGTVLEVPRARAIVPALQERIAAARKDGTPIIYVVDEHDPDDPDLDAWGTHAVKGSSGTEVWADLAPESGDRIVNKSSYSAFYESNLTNVLEELKVDTLVLTGCLTELGIMATATDAYQRGFALEVPADSQAGSCIELETATMGLMATMAPFGPSRKKLLEHLSAA